MESLLVATPFSQHSQVAARRTRFAVEDSRRSVRQRIRRAPTPKIPTDRPVETSAGGDIHRGRCLMISDDPAACKVIRSGRKQILERCSMPALRETVRCLSYPPSEPPVRCQNGTCEQERAHRWGNQLRLLSKPRGQDVRTGQSQREQESANTDFKLCSFEELYSRMPQPSDDTECFFDVSRVNMHCLFVPRQSFGNSSQAIRELVYEVLNLGLR